MNYDFYDNMNVMNAEMPFDGMLFDESFTSNNMTSNNQLKVNNDLMLFNSYEGYLKGNAFMNEYKPYKNYKVAKLNINSEKDEMLVNIGEYSFMMHDLNLYLDVHPNDQEALNKFTEYRNKVNELITNYERKYGPLGVKGNMNNNVPFEWENTSWPWGN